MKVSILSSLALAGLIAAGCADSINESTNRMLTEAEADMRLASRSAAMPPDYPVSIDCPQWRDMTSHAEKVAFLTLPESVYDSMSSEELALLCLAYPLNIDAYAFDDLATGLQRVIRNAGCYQALLRRDDCAIGIVRALQACEAVDYLQSSVTGVDKYSLLIDCNLLMQMLQIPEVSATLSPDQASEAASYLYYLAEVERKVLTDDNHSAFSPLRACEACLAPGTDLSTIRTVESPDAMLARIKAQNIKPYNL